MKKALAKLRRWPALPDSSSVPPVEPEFAPHAVVAGPSVKLSRRKIEPRYRGQPVPKVTPCLAQASVA